LIRAVPPLAKMMTEVDHRDGHSLGPQAREILTRFGHIGIKL